MLGVKAIDRAEAIGAPAGADDARIPAAPDDGPLIATLAARDTAALEALDTLYERHAPRVYGYLVAQLGPGDHAEAVLLETFACLWQSPASSPRGESTFTRWLLLRAHRLAGMAAPQAPSVIPATSLKTRQAQEAQVTLEAQVARLEDVLITAELARRAAREPDFRAENAAFLRITRQLANHASPAEIFQTLVDTATALCGAGSAGLSLLETPPLDEPDGAVFRWTHMAGVLAAAVGGTTPRAFSPCGVTLDRGAHQLFSRPARYFDYLAAVPAPIVEGLVIPLAAATGPDAAAIGTIWVVSHDPHARPFDWEDARIMTSLANFTAIALQIAAGAQVKPLRYGGGGRLKRLGEGRRAAATGSGWSQRGKRADERR